MKPVGIIHSPYKNTGEVPNQRYKREEISQIEVSEEFEEGLQDIEGFSHIIAIYWFHRSQRYELLVKPPGEDSLHGLFSTRSPRRPCPLALTVVELVARKRNVLKVKGLDAIDGTPLLDIKPYIPFEHGKRPIEVGWLEGKLGREKS